MSENIYLYVIITIVLLIASWLVTSFIVDNKVNSFCLNKSYTEGTMIDGFIVPFYYKINSIECSNIATEVYKNNRITYFVNKTKYDYGGD